MPPTSNSFAPLAQVVDAVSKNDRIRRYFSVYGIISHYRYERGRKRLTIRDEDTADVHICLNFKSGVVWNPDRRPFNRDDFEIGDVIRIEQLRVERGQCSVHHMKHLMVFKSFAKKGAVEYRTQGLAIIDVRRLDTKRPEQLQKFLHEEITSCRFSELTAESGSRSFAGRVTFSGFLNEDGHQILCLSDDTIPVIQTHVVRKEDCILTFGEISDQTIQLRITDLAPNYQQIAVNNVVVVFNAAFSHQPDTGITEITASRNKKHGNAVRVAHADSLIGEVINHFTDRNQESGDEIPDPLQHLRQKESSEPICRRYEGLNQIQEPGVKVPASGEAVSRVHKSNKILFPVFLDTPIPCNATTISQLTANPLEWMTYRLEAAAIDCNVKTYSISDIIHVRCRVCKFTQTLTDFLADDKDRFMRDAVITGSVGRKSCPKGCSENETPAFLDYVYVLFLVLRDKEEAEAQIVAHLSTFHAIKLFGVTPQDAISCLEKRERMFRILSEIWPKREADRQKNILTWIIRVVPFDKKTPEFIVLTVLPSSDPGSTTTES